MSTAIQKTRQVALAERSIERTARLLSQQFNIRVVWKHGVCKTDGKTIYLPTLPPDAPNDLLCATQGFLDHETAHVLFTDFNIGKSRKLTKNQFDAVNTIEDLRIEKRIGDFFPGAPSNLRYAREWLLGALTKDWKTISPFHQALTAFGDYVTYGDDSPEFLAVQSPEIKQQVQDCIQYLAADIKDMDSTADSIDVGLKLFEMLKHLIPDSESEDESEQDDGESNSSDESDSESEDGDGEESDEEQEASGKQSNKPSQGKGKDSKPGNSAESLKEVDSPKSLGDRLKQAAVQLIVNSGGTGAKNTSNSGYSHNIAGQKPYLVYSTKNDIVQVNKGSSLQEDGKALQKNRDEANTLTSVIKTKLVNSLRAQSRRRWVGGKEEGKINSKQLYKAALGIDNRVYKQLTDKSTLDTAVMFAIDHSGSMSGGRLSLAGKSAIVVGDALQALKIPFAVYGYSTTSPRESPSQQEQQLYSRWSDLWIHYYRDFHEPWEQGALRLAACSRNARENTLDAESVKHGIQRLLQRKEKRKILFVFNDGMPYPGYGNLADCQQHLRDVVASATKVGVEVVAFGIQSYDVVNYYPKNVVINDLNDLVKEPLTILDSMLRKGNKK